jgi:RNA polymerase sigma-70 factor (ECF subfamily)
VLIDNFGEDGEIPENNFSKDVRNDTEEKLFSKELADMLHTEIEQLKPLYKTLISLYHQEELSYAEIAEITSLPEGTVKNYIFRARKTLKENILLKHKRNEL